MKKKVADENSVKEFYKEITQHCIEQVDSLSITDLQNIEQLNREMRADDLAPYFAPSDIQKYKMIIWYANNPKKSDYLLINKVHMIQHYDLLRYYMISDGSLLYTGALNICDPVTTNTRNFLQVYGGLADTLSALTQELDTNDWIWGTPNIENSMFVAADGQGDFACLDPFNLNLQIYKIGLNWFPEYWINTPLGKIGNVTFLNVENAEPIFTCVTDTMAIHQQFADAVMGTKYTHEAVEKPVYLLGFPLYYMMPDDSKTFIDIIFDEVGVAHN